MSAKRYKFDGTKGGFRAWINEMGPRSWCCEVHDGSDKTVVVWFSSTEQESRSVLSFAGERLGCEFREIAWVG